MGKGGSKEGKKVPLERGEWVGSARSVEEGRDKGEEKVPSDCAGMAPPYPPSADAIFSALITFTPSEGRFLHRQQS